MLTVLDDIGWPYSCNAWAGIGLQNDGLSISPLIIDDGIAQFINMEWFGKLENEYPTNILINSSMEIVYILDSDPDIVQTNALIQSVLDDAIKGCTDILACNYNPDANLNVSDLCQYSQDNYDCNNQCTIQDTDDDGVCDIDDDCLDNYDPYQNDSDDDGLADACNDNDDDDDGLIDCWNFAVGEYPGTIYWDSANNLLTEEEVAVFAASGIDSNGSPCGDYALAVDEQIFPKINLGTAYPNPFNPSTTITFHLQNPGIVNIQIYDLNGYKIHNLTENFYTQGNHQLIWTPNKKISSGIYLISFETNKSFITRKVIYLK